MIYGGLSKHSFALLAEELIRPKIIAVSSRRNRQMPANDGRRVPRPGHWAAVSVLQSNDKRAGTLRAFGR